MYERLGIFEQRRRTLASCFDVAQYAMYMDSALRSVMLSCAQYWCDEASDAVQEDLRCSPLLVPVFGNLDSLHHELTQDFDWRPNTTGAWGFAAMCNEEGWVDDRGIVDPELRDIYLHHNSPVMLVQRLGDELHATWLGAPLRGWLDFPETFHERDYSGNNALPVLVPDPPPAPLLGREREIYDQVFDNPRERGAREVLRDLWIERGDPRGEITVAIDSGDQARAGELIARCGRSWLGALNAVIPLSGARFGNGPFVEEAFVYADRATFERVADAPEWGTIETLTFARGSYRALVPRMQHVRAIGPLSLAELAPLDQGRWAIEDLDVELGDDPLERLATLELPLRTLRLRISEDRQLDLAPLTRARWWSALEHLEIWIPGVAMGQPPPAERFITRFEAALPPLRGAALAVGALDSGRRTGWTLAGDANERRLELRHPDSRVGLGPILATATGLPLEPGVISLPNWLAFGLGVPSVRNHPARPA